VDFNVKVTVDRIDGMGASRDSVEEVLDDSLQSIVGDTLDVESINGGDATYEVASIDFVPEPKKAAAGDREALIMLVGLIKSSPLRIVGMTIREADPQISLMLSKLETKGIV
jgi:hypothetical protein